MSRRQTSNTEQLSLFSGSHVTAPIDNVVQEPLDARNKRNDTLGIQNPGTLEATSPANGAEPGAGESTPTGDLSGPRTNDESPVRIGSSAEDGFPSGVGARDEGVGVS